MPAFLLCFKASHIVTVTPKGALSWFANLTSVLGLDRSLYLVRQRSKYAVLVSPAVPFPSRTVPFCTPHPYHSNMHIHSVTGFVFPTAVLFPSPSLLCCGNPFCPVVVFSVVFSTTVPYLFRTPLTYRLSL